MPEREWLQSVEADLRRLGLELAAQARVSGIELERLYWQIKSEDVVDLNKVPTELMVGRVGDSINVLLSLHHTSELDPIHLEAIAAILQVFAAVLSRKTK